ncbi:PAM68 family protein [Leptothermofonsia sichuanensis E412]|uniref:PAM68 family protein n=1 Tax=Leptothermofonsia sichuanensis TaxID=2917832 RepID=UPI001CA6AB63|nr:PAM68 family protein [Leptothermofonsia sichuanensis]QZZ19016.1 PAM68 family protein [Leptothermofonsia sichuanensis E412]
MAAKSPKPSKGNGKAAASDNLPENRLPFEPAQSRKKPARKSTPATVIKADASADAKASVKRTGTSSGRSTRNQAAAIPEVISRRMARRMAFFCGIPTSMGMLTLIVSYVVITQHWYKLPNVAVLLVNLAFFGLGVLGLSYGALSASWDEDRLGSWFGWSEFKVNFARLTESWRSSKQKTDS